jgi:small subunit ribosomal protein S14
MRPLPDLVVQRLMKTVSLLSLMMLNKKDLPVAKLSSINKNNRRAAMIKKAAPKRAALKKIIMNKELPFEERLQAQIALAKMPRNSSKVRYRNRCELTGRARGTYRKFKLSRIKLRELGSFGKLPGLTKASW